ncbi:MAG TPA: 3-hydroxyacyl-ACP dehydratase FabZ [Clostridiaceae bacterium]|nr:3-hydroxyacyl-ACP dehydratase FabZ [Clostridiaceae bacterium]
MSIILESFEIEEILPHRYPFILVDRIIDGEWGEFAVGIKQVTRNEWFFDGHFPGKPIMPGVLQLEAMAQVGGVAFLGLPENKNKLALFLGVKNARFAKPVLPGDTLMIRTEFTGKKLNIGFAIGEIRSEDQLVCKVEMMFSIVDSDRI